ncbi:MAG: ferredoxin [Solirubrobacterales bacterium]
MSERPPFEIDRDLCVGHGRCYALAPEVFYPDEMGHGFVKDEVDAAALPGDPLKIVNACPEGAITYTGEEG